VDRAVIDATLSQTLAARRTAEVDPHGMGMLGNPAERVAQWILLHQSYPSYAALMFIRPIWSEADQTLRRWIVRQFAAMLLHGPQPVAKSGEYGLWVDYFETPSDAPEVFGRLTTQLPHSGWHRLLSAAGPVPWAVKRECFLEAAGIPALHAALAAGIAGSFYDVFGDVDAVEAAHLLERITVVDVDLRAALVEATTEPVRLRSGSAIVVEDLDWEHPGSFLLDATFSGSRGRFVPGSELVADDVVRGTLVHWGFPFDETLAHRVIPGRRLDGHPFWYRVKGDPQGADALVDRELDAWPPGLRQAITSRSGTLGSPNRTGSADHPL
jgi:hypothetical protein